jgi:hypothetical protein
VDRFVTFQTGKPLNGFSGFFLGEAQVVKTLEIESEFRAGPEEMSEAQASTAPARRRRDSGRRDNGGWGAGKERGPVLGGQDGAGETEWLDLGDVFSLEAFGALADLKLDKLAFVQRLVAVHLDGGEVNENILARLALNEPVPLGSVEPLDDTLFSSQR